MNSLVILKCYAAVYTCEAFYCLWLHRRLGHHGHSCSDFHCTLAGQQQCTLPKHEGGRLRTPTHTQGSNCKFILCFLHCLLIELHIKFKVLVLIFKVLHSQGPAYIKDLLILQDGKGFLPSKEQKLSVGTEGQEAQLILRYRFGKLWTERCNMIAGLGDSGDASSPMFLFS